MHTFSFSFYSKQREWSSRVGEGRRREGGCTVAQKKKRLVKRYEKHDEGFPCGHRVLVLGPLALLTWVGVGEQRADGEENLGDGERRAPLLLQNVQADLTAAVDVAVIDPRAERHLRDRG